MAFGQSNSQSFLRKRSLHKSSVMAPKKKKKEREKERESTSLPLATMRNANPLRGEAMSPSWHFFYTTKKGKRD